MSTADPSCTLAPFCRLCLSETSNKVPVFGPDKANVINLLMLVELDIDPDNEQDAGVCFDCIVTLEGFYQFKEQCHVNDEFLKTVAPKESAEGSEDEEPAGMHYDYLEDEPAKPVATAYESSDEEGLVKDDDYVEALLSSKRVFNSSESIKPDVKHESLNPVWSRKPPEFRHFGEEELETIGQQLNISALDKLQVLQDSYPDYFHFERGKRSVYFTLVFYGERYNSANFNDSYTVWQCANRRRFQCPAQVCVTNDYTEFERRFEHTHGDVEETEPCDLYTPKQALPEVFKLCRQNVMKRKAKGRQVSLEKRMKKEEEATKLRRNVPVEEVLQQNQTKQVYDNNSLLRVLRDGDEDDEHDDDFVEYDSSDSLELN
uniref:ZAD domain-containing protein n=1 Tax=Culex tarsalis TaxID=7177 RepID=A0A1Q3F259_CULTA